MTELPYLPWRRPAAYDDRPCVQDDVQSLTYAEFSIRVDAVAEQFAERGVSLGSVVAIMLPNRVELLVAMTAAWRLGAAATPFNPAFTRTEAAYQIRDADAALVVTAGPRCWPGGSAVPTRRRCSRASRRTPCGPWAHRCRPPSAWR